MGRVPNATEVYNTPQKNLRQSPWLVPDHIVIHHAASTSFDGVVKMELGTKQVSSTVVVKDNRVASMFEEEPYRAWSLSSAQWDSRSLSSETVNESTDGWTISEASYRTLAIIVAFWCRKYNIPCNRDRILGHREVYTRHGASYPTACPGGIDLDRLVRDALAILNGANVPSLDNQDFINLLTASFDNRVLGGGHTRTIQNALSAVYFYGDLQNTQAKELKAQIESLSLKLDALAKPVPATVDTAAIVAGVTKALGGKLAPSAADIAEELAKRLND